MLDLLGDEPAQVRMQSTLTFADFWVAYPKRRGPNPKIPAEKKFYAAVKSGVDPERIINSAKAYADELRGLKQYGTEFVCQARTWLNQCRWEDYAPDPGSADRNAKLDAMMAYPGPVR